MHVNSLQTHTNLELSTEKAKLWLFLGPCLILSAEFKEVEY